MAVLRAIAIGASFMLVLAGCGDDDADGGASATFGACSRSDGTAQACIEITASAADVENQREGCFEVGGTWSEEPCPEPETGVCCDYTFGNEFRECAYDAMRGASLETSCTDMFGEDCSCTTY